MRWIDREVEFPDCDLILCYSDGRLFICYLVETKWGNFYHLIDDGERVIEWTHWMPLPELPKKD